MGACTGYVVIIGELLSPFFNEWFPNRLPIHIWELIFSIVVTVVVLYPLTILKRVDSLRFTSFFAVLCIFYIVITVLIQSILIATQPTDLPTPDVPPPPPPQIQRGEMVWFRLSFEMISILPIMTVAYTFHTNLFAIRAEMKSPEKFPIAMSIAMFGGTLSYVIVGVSGYLAFGSIVNGNILTNYPNNEWMITIGNTSIHTLYLILICRESNFVYIDCIFVPCSRFSYQVHLF